MFGAPGSGGYPIAGPLGPTGFTERAWATPPPRNKPARSERRLLNVTTSATLQFIDIDRPRLLVPRIVSGSSVSLRITYFPAGDTDANEITRGHRAGPMGSCYLWEAGRWGIVVLGSATGTLEVALLDATDPAWVSWAQFAIYSQAADQLTVNAPVAPAVADLWTLSDMISRGVTGALIECASAIRYGFGTIASFQNLPADTPLFLAGPFLPLSSMVIQSNGASTPTVRAVLFF